MSSQGDSTDQEVGVRAELAENEGYAQRPKCFSSTLQECLFVLTATMAIGQQSFFQGAIVGVTASIGKDLNMNPAEITWINAGSSLSSGAFLLTFGKVADTFGRKILFIIGMGGFSLALLIAGFATNAIYMDVFSGIIGLFAAAVVPPAVGALGAVYEKQSKRKNRAFACFSAGNPLGFVGGMIISGIASHEYNWRASFWALAVIYALFTVLTVWTVPADGFAKTPMTYEAFQRFDILGQDWLAGDAPDGWKTGYVLALFIVGFFLLVAFIYWQSIAEHPLMPLWVWKDRNFSLLMVIFVLGFMGFSAMTFYISLYLQELKKLSALEITLRLLPMVISGILVNVACGLVLHRVSNKILTGIGAAAYTAAFLILSFMKEETVYWAFIFPAIVLVVVGADIQFNVTNMYVMSSLPSHQQSIAGGIFNTVSKLCNNLGLGIATSVRSAIASQMIPSTPAIRPYLGAYWFAAAAAGLSLFFVPFLTLGTQGGDSEKAEEQSVIIVENKFANGKGAIPDSASEATPTLGTVVAEKQ
ncbi:hypothetical protein N7468_010546 [Penicillium chermesinum]|uniref:Major facilitator superfamily (MFS) profile domain-containing protein n=1 Tax=Penicillium chermesinum TaxID=63820 RepID=A0A9W9N7Y2_9EURO|nr:uncharacterized protein N7468_010546 [Penicillium chermesinum]KAJ5214867.1 hypothetical protein N7468_010546 [Penicillium chermesinum]